MDPVAKTDEVVLRRLRRSDREAVREIFRQGGQRGNPLRVYVEDEEVVLRVLVDYFVDYEPECAVVAEANGRVVGYALAAADTKRYERRVLTRILPRIAARVAWKTLTLQYRTMKTYSLIWWFLTRAWRELPEVSLDRFPVTVHINLSREYRGHGLGRRLMDAEADHLRSLGLPGGHGIVVEEAHRNVFARVLGATLLGTRPTTIWRHCSDQKWDFKLLIMHAVPPTGEDACV